MTDMPLIELGFTEDAPVRVLRSNKGPLIVALNNSKYALSKGMAMKIMIRSG